MDNSDTLWHWLWYVGAGLIWTAIAGLIGYLRTQKRDRITELEKKVASLESQVETLMRERKFWQDEYQRLREAYGDLQPRHPHRLGRPAD